MLSKSVKAKKYEVGFKEASKLIFRYAKKRIMEQIKAVATMIIFLIFFQTVVLGIALTDASIIASGLVLVVMGLTFFLEGLMLGLMPLGEAIGIKLPKKAPLLIILVIAFILGVGATFAEPAIGVLRLAGQSVLAWQAPLLFVFLNRFSNYLVYAVGTGVGIAVMIGTLRFLYGWSLKPLIYIIVSILIGLSLYAYTNSNLNHLLGLAWDCGGVTTGPVTVPLILALGIGISQVAKKRREKSAGGFGVVTLASLLPIIAVLIIAIMVEPKVPKPMPVTDFVSYNNRQEVEFLFNNTDEFKGYILMNTEHRIRLSLFDNDPGRLREYIREIDSDAHLLQSVFGSRVAFDNWVLSQGDEELKLEVFGSQQNLEAAAIAQTERANAGSIDFDFIKRNLRSALQAILPLSLFLLLILLIIIREKLAKTDELILGIAFAIIGLSIFFGGIELGLVKVGEQVGRNLPASFTKIEIPEERKIISSFDLNKLNHALLPDGESKQFFYLYEQSKYIPVEFEGEYYLPESEQYIYTPRRGPLFGRGEYSLAGIFVILLFAFLVGYGATLAEPALCALGLTVEELTVGTFKKSLLIQAVAVGVGCGIVAGMCKIIWNLPLFWMLIPPYILLLIITKISTEEYVDIGWDAAGVTTGPITVPLVITMGLGISSQVGIIEGFGILSLASVCPILSVLFIGLVVNYKRKKVLGSLTSFKEDEGQIV